MPSGPDRGEPRAPARSRLRLDRLIFGGGLALLVVLLAGYLVLRKASGFSWPYITNSVLLSALFLTNALLVLTLVIVMMRNLIKALVERRRGILGSRFRTKLVFSLLLLWLVPSGIIFWAALHLIQRSVDRWFNEPMDRMTEASQEIVDTYYGDARRRGAAFAAEAARRLQAGQEAEDAGAADGGTPGGRATGSLPAAPGAERQALAAILAEYHLDLLALTPRGRRPVVVLDARIRNARLDPVPRDQMDAAWEGHPFTWISDFGGGHMIRCGHPVRPRPDGPVASVVIAGVFVPRNLARLAAAVTRSNDDYRQIKAQKGLIKRVYVLVFALITLVVLFSVTWIGLYLARRITEPIQSLAQGTREISSGNLDFRVAVEAGDELGILVDSFNRMTAELKAGKETIERRNLELSARNQELMERRRYIETLLQGITTGVISLDREGRIATVNRAALRLVGLDRGEEPIGRPLPEMLAPEARPAIESLAREVTAGAEVPAARGMELSVHGRVLTLAVSATALRGDHGEHLGAILVLEDLTDLMRAQKIAAWREVARRLAHEIKNPLTPIQLFAERIRKKYSERSRDLDAVVEEGTAAIVHEVAGLKGLVDEFTRFARLPAPNPSPTNLQDVVTSALALYNGAHAGVEIRPVHDGDLPRVLVDQEQMKRALVNLIDNAVEALGGRGTVTVETRLDRDSGVIRLEVADDGPGIRAEDRERLFLPYFSTKKKGTGLGLAIVHRIVSDHHGRIRVEDNRPRGARFVIELPAAA